MDAPALARSYATCTIELLRVIAADAAPGSVQAVDAFAAADEIASTLDAYAHLWVADG